jgi:hypothetical protein
VQRESDRASGDPVSCVLSIVYEDREPAIAEGLEKLSSGGQNLFFPGAVSFMGTEFEKLFAEKEGSPAATGRLSQRPNRET